MKLKNICLLFMLITAGTAFAQNATSLKGTVYDAQTRKPIPDVNIRVEGETRTMASTDSLGNYTIKVNGENALFSLSFPGYKPYKKYLRRGQPTLDVFLINSRAGVVSNTIFYTPNNASSAFAYDNVLNGKVAGLNATRRSGMEMEGSAMLIRGLKTFRANTQPLIILDGMPVEDPQFKSVVDGYTENHLNFLDVKDIEKVTVLKNGSAIYGAQAANGVIVIETQMPKEAKTYIDFTALGGMRMKPKAIPMMNVNEYTSFAIDQLTQSGLNGNDILSGYGWLKDKTNYPLFNNHTDWQSEIFDEAVLQNYHLNVKGGDAMAKYCISIGYTDEKNVVKRVGTSRYNTHLNGDLQIIENLTMKANLGYSVLETSLMPFGINKDINPVTAALMKPPVLTPYQIRMNEDNIPQQLNLLEDVDPLGFSNPRSIIDNSDIVSNSNHFMGALNLEYQINKNLKANALVGLDYNKVRQDLFIPSLGIVKLDGVEYNRKAQRFVQNYSGVYTDFRLNYSNLNRIHRLDAFAGVNYKSNSLTLNRGTDYAMPNDQFKGLGSGSWNASRSAIDMKQVWTGQNKMKYANAYLSANYAYLDRYYINVNASINGNSRYGDNNKTAFFHSEEIGWNISAEPFMDGLKNLDKLSIHLKSSLLGNDGIGDFRNMLFYRGKMYRNVAGLVKGNIANNNLKWESTQQFDLGMDVSLFKQRITLAANVYLANTKGLILWHSYPEDRGHDGYWMNGGKIVNKGVEVSVYTRIVDNRQFKWNFGVTFATNKSEIKALPNDAPVITSIYEGKMISKIGGAPYEFYGLQAEGVYTKSGDVPAELVDKNGHGFQAGDVKYRQVEDDGIIDEKDFVSLGSPLPDYYGGFNTNMAWKGFNLYFYFTYKYGNKAFNHTRMITESQSGLSNQSTAVNARWRNEGDATNMPRTSWGAARNNAFSSRFIEDASYLRLNNVRLSYNLPYKNAVIRNITLFVEGNNLLTFTKYLGYDPEFSYSNQAYLFGSDYAQSPLSKSVFAGFKLGL